MQSFFVHDHLLASRPVPRVQLSWGDWVEPLSRALICPECGSLWSRVQCGTNRWSPIVAACPDCPHALGIPGSILIPGFPELNPRDPSMPIEVLAYEFQQTLKAFERTYEAC